MEFFMGKVWTLQDAKNKFSAVVEAAQRGEPQHVTKRGVDAVVVLSADDYERLTQTQPKKTFVEHLLSAPKLPEAFEDLFDKDEPMTLGIREFDFEG
jgi:prevent-host-death family protein